MCVIGHTIMSLATQPGEYPLSADGAYWKRIAEDLRAELSRLHVRIERLTRNRDDLMRVLDPLLSEIEPFRQAQREEIERQVAAKQEWAARYNATCGNSNEMWFYSAEFRRDLESRLEPLLTAIREANEVYDRIERLQREAKESRCGEE
jgi:hypothetical protein